MKRCRLRKTGRNIRYWRRYRQGLVLADDVNEAVKKVFSILDKASNLVGEAR